MSDQIIPQAEIRMKKSLQMLQENFAKLRTAELIPVF